MKPDKYTYFDEQQALTADVADISHELRQIDRRRTELMQRMDAKCRRLANIAISENLVRRDGGITEQEWLGNETV